LDRIFSYVVAPERRGLLYLDPAHSVRDAVAALQASASEDELTFIGDLLGEWSRAATVRSSAQKERAEVRIEQSLRAMRDAFRTTLFMHNVMFYLGVTLIAIGVVGAFSGKPAAGIVIGGVGLVDLIFFLLKEPVEGIHESVGDLMQLRTAYSSYFVQLDQWGLYYDWQHDEASIEAKKQAAAAIHEYTRGTLDLLRQPGRPITSHRPDGPGMKPHAT
jgi:hypothetical protein